MHISEVSKNHVTLNLRSIFEVETFRFGLPHNVFFFGNLDIHSSRLTGDDLAAHVSRIFIESLSNDDGDHEDNT